MNTTTCTPEREKLRIALMPRVMSCPADALCGLISPQAVQRAETFLSEKRRSEFLWSRVLLSKLLDEEPQAVLTEAPPRSPTILGSVFSHTCIAHTQTWIGAGVGTALFGFDLEVMNPARVNEALFTRLFAQRHWDESHNRVLDFYRFFGMYESAVKMNLPFASDCPRPFVGGDPHNPCVVRFFSDGTTLLSVVSQTQADVELCVFELDAAGSQLSTTSRNSFAELKVPFGDEDH